jgi:DNA-binding MarR family transcriptional regulator
MIEKSNWVSKVRDTLVDKGYLEKRSVDKRTNEYTLTDAGRGLLAERREWEAEQLAESADN